MVNGLNLAERIQYEATLPNAANTQQPAIPYAETTAKKLTLTGIAPRVKWLAVQREHIGIQQALATELEQRHTPRQP